MAVTLCPVALAAGCRRCPIFTVCPLKSVIGDQPAGAPEPPSAKAAKPAGKDGGGKRPRQRG
jgi:hypothetical protein